jgi:hypothetical protein
MARFFELGLDTIGGIAGDRSSRALSGAQVIQNVINQAVLADELSADDTDAGLQPTSEGVLRIVLRFTEAEAVSRPDSQQELHWKWWRTASGSQGDVAKPAQKYLLQDRSPPTIRNWSHYSRRC